MAVEGTCIFFCIKWKEVLKDLRSSSTCGSGRDHQEAGLEEEVSLGMTATGRCQWRWREVDEFKILQTKSTEPTDELVVGAEWKIPY